MDQQQVVGVPQADSKDVTENKIWAAISYLGIIGLIVLFVKKDSPFAQFHAKQGSVLFAAEIIFMLPIINFIGWIVEIVILVFAIMGIINAAQGKLWKMPVLGDLAAKIKV